MIIGKRSRVKDDNNYIKQKGKITFFCENCGRIITKDIHITEKEDKLNYRFMCNQCFSLMTQIDNLMADIYKILNEKGYKIEICCEGHWTEGNRYNLPLVYLYGNIKDIKPLIPSSFYNKFHIGHVIGRDITCITYKYLPYITSKKDFNSIKEEGLEILTYLVKSLPNCPLTYNQIHLDFRYL